MTDAVDCGDPVDIIFLEKLGIGVQILQWIKNWLSDRKQRVVLNGQESDWADVDSRFPQGSILGPFDIDLAVKLVDIIRKLADDTVPSWVR